MKASFRVLFSVLLLTSCESSNGLTLRVDLRTDFVPGVEVTRVQTIIDGRTEEAVLAQTDDGIEGIRIAQFDGLDPGGYELRVRFLEGIGPSVEQPVRVELRDDLGITVLVTRDCRATTCPPSDDPELTSCVNEICVAPECSEVSADLDACPPPSCTSDTECPNASDCTMPVCREGRCLLARRAGACTTRQWCSPETGCETLPTEDAGVLDAGAPDSGRCGLGCMDTVTELAAAESHACAIVNGLVACWGDNRFGQLGIDTPMMLNAPMTVSGFDDAVALSASASGWCAVRTNGQVVCSGDVVTGIPPIRAMPESIEGGFGHTCAIADDGTVHCWGSNSEGQLGDGTTTSGGPVQVAGLSGIVALGLGDEHSCASDGTTTWCWGSNTSGQLGLGTTGPAEPSPMVAQFMNARELAGGIVHSCGRSGTAISCWGGNTSGQIGNGAMGPPVLAPTDLGLRVSAISVWENSSCAVTDSGVQCWGLLPNVVLSPSPTPVAGTTDVTRIVAGDTMLCVLDAGVVRCAGLNNLGQIGDGTFEDRDQFVPVSDIAPPE